MLIISKPKIDHKQTIFDPIFLLIIFLFIFSSQFLLLFIKRDNRILGASINIDNNKIVFLTNKEREKKNLKILKVDEQLTKAAEKKLADMFYLGYWDHLSPVKRPPWNFMLEEGYDYHFAGENLAKDFDNEENLVKAWMDSPDHQANILNNKYEEIGIATANGQLNGKETILVVQMFGTKFNASDYQKATEENLMENLKSSFILSPKKITFKELLYNRFLTTKVMAFGIVIVLMIYMAWKFNVVNKKKGIQIELRKYWGHFIFLIALGIIIWITRDGNIM